MKAVKGWLAASKYICVQVFKTAFKKLPKQTISLQIFLRLSSTNFTWSILEYFDPSYGMSFIDLEQQTFIASFIPGLRETAQKMKFFVKGLVTFTEETLNGKLHFLCGVSLYIQSSVTAT